MVFHARRNDEVGQVKKKGKVVFPFEAMVSRKEAKKKGKEGLSFAALVSRSGHGGAAMTGYVGYAGFTPA